MLVATSAASGPSASGKPQWGWSDDNEPPPVWWLGATPDPSQEPEFDFGDGCALSLDAADPFPPDDVPVFRWD